MSEPIVKFVFLTTRKMRRNHQFSQQGRKITPKIVSSQDVRKVKVTRKNDNSQSPIPREAHLNKENQHPNLLLQANISSSKLSKAQKSSSEHIQSTVRK